MSTNFIISRFLVLRLLKFVKADTAFIKIFKPIFSNPSVPKYPLIRTVGIIPVTYTVYHLYGFLNSDKV
jgi:hypothetical protein